MTKTTWFALLAPAAAAALAWGLGGARGVGVLAGALAAAAVTLVGVARQRKSLERSPRRLAAAMAEGFLLKLGVLLGCALLLRFVEPLAARADWQSFVLAFAATALIVLLPGSLEAARLAQGGRA
jgi:hypothetical protein